MDADTSGVNAEMAPSGSTVATPSTYQVALTAYQIANRNIADARTDLDHFPAELMAHGYGWLESLPGPLVPRLDVQIGAADARRFDSDEHIARFDGGYRDIHQLKAWPGFDFPQRPHMSHFCTPCQRPRVP
jgi:hypothetical protein